MNLTNTKIYFTCTLQLKNQRKNKNWLKFPQCFSIWGKIPRLFQYIQNSITGKCIPIFTGSPVNAQTMVFMCT